jgi:hypothetical protein
MYTHQGPVLSVCWNKVCVLTNLTFLYAVRRVFMTTGFRKEIKFSLGVLIMLHAYLILQRGSRNKLPNMMPLLRSSNGSIHREVFLLQVVGTRPSRCITPFSIQYQYIKIFSPLQYWDLRSPTPVVNTTLPERCYTMDVQFPLMVVGTAERHIQIFNLTNPVQPYKVCLISTLWALNRFCPDHPITSEVADSRSILFLGFYDKWIRCWEHRRPRCYPVRD